MDGDTGEILEEKVNHSVSGDQTVGIMMDSVFLQEAEGNGKIFRDFPLERSEDEFQAAAKWYYDRARDKALKEN